MSGGKMWPPSSPPDARARCLPRARLAIFTGVALLIAVGLVGRARAADVSFLNSVSNSQSGTRTLRVPNLGSLAAAGPDRYVVVGVAISGVDHTVSGVNWDEQTPMGNVVRALTRQSVRDVDMAGLACRAEIWAGPAPAGTGIGVAQVSVTPKFGTSTLPTLAATLMVFSNVGSTSIDGACCVNSANSGTNNSTISKTLHGSSMGDAVVNAVCTRYGGAAPGTPMPDPAMDPEMVPRSFLTLSGSSLQHFAGYSPGSTAVRPATSYRHLRWLQSGTRSWAITGTNLHATTTTSGTGGSSGTGGAMAGTGGSSGAGGVMVGTGGVMAGTGGMGMGGAGSGSAGGMAGGTGGASGVDMDAGNVDMGGGGAGTAGGNGGGGGAPTDPDAAAGAGGGSPFPPIEDDGGAGPAVAQWRVGCACSLGGARDMRPGSSGLVPTFALLALLLRRLRPSR